MFAVGPVVRRVPAVLVERLSLRSCQGGGHHSQRDSGRDGSGLVTVTMDPPVTLTAPPASQVIDGSKLGM